MKPWQPIVRKLNIRMMILPLVIMCYLVGLILKLSFLNQDLWFDESGQYWISQGLSHQTDNFSPGNVKQVISSNQKNNLDPPLFSLILHFWTKTDDSIVFMRTLPVLLFIVSIFFIYQITNLLNYDTLEKIITISLYNSSHTLFFYSQELRAYSLTILLSTITLYFLLKYLHTNNTKDLIFISLSCFIGLFSQYGFWLLIPTITLFILKNKNKTKFHFPFYILLITAGVILTYLISAQYHLPHSGISYLNSFKIATYLNKPQFFKTWLTLNFNNLIYSIPIATRPIIKTVTYSLIFYLTIVYITKQRLKSKKYQHFVLFFLLQIILINILSIINKYPLGDRWNLFYSWMIIPIISKPIGNFIKQNMVLSIISSVLLSLILIVNLVQSFQNKHTVSKLDSILKELNWDTTFYLFSNSTTPTFKYHYKDFPKKQKFVASNTNNQTIGLQNLKTFLDKNTSTKNLTILFSKTDDSSFNKSIEVITNHSRFMRYKIKTIRKENNSAIIITAN